MEDIECSCWNEERWKDFVMAMCDLFIETYD